MEIPFFAVEIALRLEELEDVWEKENKKIEVLFKSVGLEIDWELLFTIIVFKTFRKESFRIIPMDNLEFNAFRGISKSGSVKVNPVGVVGRSIEIIGWLHGAVQRRDAITWRRRSKADERIPFQQDDLWRI